MALVVAFSTFKALSYSLHHIYESCRLTVSTWSCCQSLTSAFEQLRLFKLSHAGTSHLPLTSFIAELKETISGDNY